MKKISQIKSNGQNQIMSQRFLHSQVITILLKNRLLSEKVLGYNNYGKSRLVSQRFLMSMFKDLFERCRLDLNVYPYQIISNRTDKSLNVGKIIEVVLLYECFINLFGQRILFNFKWKDRISLRIKLLKAFSVISDFKQIQFQSYFNKSKNVLAADKYMQGIILRMRMKKQLQNGMTTFSTIKMEY